MEKTINKVRANVNVGAGINVAAAQAVNVNKNEQLEDKQSNDYALALRGELRNPEVTGSDTLDIKFEFPFGGRLEIKATSQVTSSVMAQQTLNEEARKNMEQLASFLTKVGMAIAPAITGVKEAIREQDAKDEESRAKSRRAEQSLDIELSAAREEAEHNAEVERIKREHEIRVLRKKQNDEYDSLFESPKE